MISLGTLTADGSNPKASSPSSLSLPAQPQDIKKIKLNKIFRYLYIRFPKKEAFYVFLYSPYVFCSTLNPKPIYVSGIYLNQSKKAGVVQTFPLPVAYNPK